MIKAAEIDEHPRMSFPQQMRNPAKLSKGKQLDIDLIVSQRSFLFPDILLTCCFRLLT